MNSPLHTVSALLVSASEAQTKRIGALLTRARIVPFEHADSVRQALDLFDAGSIDGVLIAEPVTGQLRDRSWHCSSKSGAAWRCCCWLSPRTQTRPPPCWSSPGVLVAAE